MPKIQYKNIKLSGGSVELVEKCNDIIADYQAQGFTLTLRQIYYQLVARDLFPDDRRWRWTGSKYVRDPNGTKNADPNYKWLGNIVNDARLAGLIDWLAIEDRTRNLRSLSHWNGPEEIIEAVSKQFRHDKWKGQRYRPEVWIEKDALVGVIEGVCEEWDVPYFSCRGYTSQSEMWGASQRMLKHMDAGQKPFVIHLGDHDPSGKDMSRDISDRLELFCDGKVAFKRIALNMDQIEQYDPPPNPAKITDSRSTAYIAEFGAESWELDALEPAVIAALIRAQISSIVRKEQWKEAEAAEAEDRRVLTLASEKWEEVEEYLTK